MILLQGQTMLDVSRENAAKAACIFKRITDQEIDQIFDAKPEVKASETEK
jgi:hypothetical protein